MVQSTFELPDKESDLEEFETQSYGSGSGSGGGRNSLSRTSTSSNQKPKFATHETKVLSWLRIGTFIILIGTAITVCTLTYQYLNQNEHTNFKIAITNESKRVVNAFELHSKRNIGLMKSFTKSITSYTLHNTNNVTTWPYVTLPDYERQARTIADLCYGVFSVIFIPLVEEGNEQQRKALFEDYAVANQYWLNEGLSIQQDELIENYLHSGYLDETSVTTASFVPQVAPRIGGKITKIVSSSQGDDKSIIVAVDDHDHDDSSSVGSVSLYLPQWQIAPAILQSYQVLLDLLSHPSYKQSLQVMLDIKTTIVGRSFEFIKSDDVATNF